MVFSMLHSPRILVLGLGRIDRGDAGIGIHLARSLRTAFDEVAVEEAPEIPQFSSIFESYDVVILLAAICLSSEVGRVLVVSPFVLNEIKTSGDGHLDALTAELEAARNYGHRLPRIEIVGVCLKAMTSSEVSETPELSKEVRGKYDVILSRVKVAVADLVRSARTGSIRSVSR